MKTSPFDAAPSPEQCIALDLGRLAARKVTDAFIQTIVLAEDDRKVAIISTIALHSLLGAARGAYLAHIGESVAPAKQPLAFLAILDAVARLIDACAEAMAAKIENIQGGGDE